MQCPQCQHDNPSQAKFCLQCGTRLALMCAQCSTELPAGAKFCLECGQPVSGQSAGQSKFTSPAAYTPKHLADKILTSRSALEGERKQVTVLFVDVLGFTSLSERLDPEEVHGMMNRAFELMLTEVHRYEGTVNQFLGDGIMALFGAPIAHEDHAQRAVHAALGIRKALEGYQVELRSRREISFQVRQGLNTGLVVVGSIGNDLRMDYTAVGDTTNVAARFLAAADPGRIAISEATHRLVGGYFYTRSLGEFSLKGKAEPVGAWEVISAQVARTRLDVEAERGLTPFVGRDRELQLLLECFEKARAGDGQVVFIVGEPGIGKSRLLLEFRRRLGDEATWLEGRAMSFGRTIAFHPLIDMLRRNFRIEEGDSEVTIVTKIERGVLRLGEDLRPTLPYLRYLLSVDPGDPAVLSMDPQQRRGEIFDALRRLTVRASEVRPQVAVYEDGHWMDQATETYLLFTADSIPTSRVLRILTYRTGYSQPFGERTYHTRIALNTLSTEHSVEIAQALLATESLPEELKALIVRKAEGNPFFVEEVVKSLQEVGALRRTEGSYVLAKRLEEIVVPDTIQDVIMARIDRLEEAPKRTLQLASVIGREFTRRLLDRLAEIRAQTEEFLRELKAIELIYEKSVFPELAYMFKHALTHEVAYNSLLVQRRKELHRLIALAIEELYADRLADQFEVLAYHFTKGEEWAKALEYLLKAAEKAAQAFAIREAVVLYDQALEAAGQLGAAVDARTLMAIHQAKSNLYFVLSDFERSRAEGERLLTLARQTQDRESEGAALVRMAYASRWAHDFDRALASARQAIAVGEEADAKSALAGGLFITGLIHSSTGRLDQAKDEYDRALTVSRSGGDALHQSFSLSYLGLLKNWAGEYSEASGFLSEALPIAREHNLLVPLLNSFFAYGLTLTGKGNYDAALATFEEGLDLSEKVGNEVYHHRLLNGLGWLYIELGDLDRALNLNRQSAEGARKRGDHEVIANAELNLGDIFLAKGDLASAQEYLDGVYRLVNDPATSDWLKWRYSTHLFASLGELWLVKGDAAKAQEFADQCLELATRTNSRKYLVKGWRFQGEIALARRQWDEAESSLRQALTTAQAIGNPTQLWKTHLALGQLQAAAKRREQARQSFQAARAVIDQVKANLQNPGLRASFENSPLIRRVYDLSTPS
ncbi:MAG: adenylate/guanylate cyclase domain-containing protein [Candidatus Entotheonellia bacterium]